MAHGQIIVNELEHEIVDNKKGCIVIDAGVFFPYMDDPENPLVFSLDIGVNPLEDVKLNHRYPNRGYYTITRKYGRRVSKIGYPYFVDLSDEPRRLLLTIHVGVGEDIMHICVPVVVCLTEDLPCCVLNLKFLFEKGEFSFESYKKDGIGWRSHSWIATKNSDAEDSELETIMGAPGADMETHTLFFDTEIRPFAQKMEDLLVL